MQLAALSALLLALADQAAATLQPPARGAAVAASLRELAGLGDARVEVSPTALRDLYRCLAEPRPDDDAAVAARRRTCGELAALPALTSEEPRTPLQLAAFEVLRRALALPGGDPRAVQVRATALREVTEATTALADPGGIARAVLNGLFERIDVLLAAGTREAIEIAREDLRSFRAGFELALNSRG